MTGTAWITLRHAPHYRIEAFAEGLRRHGYRPELRFPEAGEVRLNDVVLTWNLSPRFRGVAQQTKAAGAVLIVAENGYVEAAGDPDPWFALALDGHNGSGAWRVGAQPRWPRLRRELRPWRDDPNGHVLIAAQRGIGSDMMRCPPQFVDHTVREVRRNLLRLGQGHVEVRVRPHPGRHPPRQSLAEDLRGARCVVTWASNVANLALMWGVPATRRAPYHVNAAAATDLSLIGEPHRPEREAAFEALAWAQWGLREVESGEPFGHLLDLARGPA